MTAKIAAILASTRIQPARAADLRNLVNNEACVEEAGAKSALSLRDHQPEEACVLQGFHILPWILLAAVRFGRAER